MLRFIIREKSDCGHGPNLHLERFYTIDVDVPQLEYALRQGGHGPSTYEAHALVGVEILGEGGKHG